ncbi:MAG: hypothetical protein L3K17_06095 [Thermoplasmata archaeon]|nr:hypothetical protein [Thermoplasmata archaeon]
MGTSAPAPSQEPWGTPTPPRYSRSDIVQRARADLALELARRGLPVRVDVVGAVDLPEIEVRPASPHGGGGYRFRLTVTTEPPEVQVPRLLEQVLGRGQALTEGSPSASDGAAADGWCAPG